MTNNNTPIYNKGRYAIYTGNPEHGNETPDLIVYKVVNLDTEVVETETSILATAVQYMISFDDALEEAQNQLEPTEKIEFQH